MMRSYLANTWEIMSQEEKVRGFIISHTHKQEQQEIPPKAPFPRNYTDGRCTWHQSKAPRLTPDEGQASLVSLEAGGPQAPAVT